MHVHYASPNIETFIHDLQCIQLWSDVAYQLRQQENAIGQVHCKLSNQLL